MTRQIAVRLPEDIVAFIDQMVGEGKATSRAAVVARAVERERRRELADRDARILSGPTTPDDLDDLTAHVAKLPLGLD